MRLRVIENGGSAYSQSVPRNGRIEPQKLSAKKKGGQRVARKQTKPQLSANQRFLILQSRRRQLRSSP